MLNVLPHNTSIPEYVPERKSPIYTQITRKYPCHENIANLTNEWASLSWKIQMPDPTMVWTSVKLVLPLQMQANNQRGVPVDMRVTSRQPGCNIAVAESPFAAFQSSSLTLNGKVFSEINEYRRLLDTCYRGTGPSSYGDNHSLKPVVCRSIKAGRDTVVSVLDENGAATGDTIDTTHIDMKTLQSAFSLLENNGPFIERARKFQDELGIDGKTWSGLITNYLELGPFMARARVGNTAVPYIRDFHLVLDWAKNISKFDALNGSQTANLPGSVSSCRSVPCKLFEFGTIQNILHYGDTTENIQYADWINSFACTWTEKPYLEVCYTKYLDTMKPYYNLRCFERQYQHSNDFVLEAVGRTSAPTLARVTSRLLSYPTKIYVWGEQADSYKGTFCQGGTRRSCRLKNIHFRLNSRPDIIFNP